jgi:ATP-dependent RNA helicase SUPV3L1/SUV3
MPAEPANAELAQAPQPAPEVKWDEIWRPRRQGRHAQGPRRSKNARHTQPEERGQQAGKFRRGGRPERRDRRRDGPPQRRDERPRGFLQSAGPPAKGGVDPDSPFAALHSLKLALEKPGQD